MSFNQPLNLGVIPNTVRYLKFENNFNKSLSDGLIPLGVTHLTFGHYFDESLVIPESVTNLTFGKSFKQKYILPKSVMYLNDIYVLNIQNKINIIHIENCVICLENKSTLITICNYQYCNICFEEWCKNSKSCAYCRTELNNNDDLFLIKTE